MADIHTAGQSCPLGDVSLHAATAPKRFRRSRALVIGVDRYASANVPSLANARRDAQCVARVLAEGHGYEVITLFDADASREAIQDNLGRLLAAAGADDAGSDDRLVVYFAGHGLAELDEARLLQGFLLPADARRDDSASMVSMAWLRDRLAETRCHHLLVMLDCCFAGLLAPASYRDFLPDDRQLEQERYDHYLRRRAHQLLVSAAHDELAADKLEPRVRIDGSLGEHSPFALALIEALARSAADLNKDRVVTATDLYAYVRERLEQLGATRQTPSLWPLVHHDGGEFVFLTGEPDLPPAIELDRDTNPYQGLQSFLASDAHLFFGRERVQAALAERIDAQRLTVVSGPSGIGKSSLLQAGIVARAAQRGQTCTVRPQGSAVAALGAALQTLRDPGEADLLLVIDPLEEIVTMAVGAEAQRDAIALLQAMFQWALGAPAALQRITAERPALSPLASRLDRTRVVLGLRSDFEALFAEEVAGHGPDALASWQRCRFFVRPMNREELRDAIEKPAAERVIFFESAERREGRTLVDGLLDEVEQMPGALPLLSDALSEMYLCYLETGRADRTLRWTEVDAVGGVAGAFQRRADRVVDDAIREQPELSAGAVERLLLRMVSFSAGERARRRVARAELWFDNPTEDLLVRSLLNRLVSARLIVGGGVQGDAAPDGEPDWQSWFEPAHDALVRSWPRLQRWIGASLERLLVHRRFTDAAREWWERGKPRSHLWADERLDLLHHFSSAAGRRRTWARTLAHSWDRGIAPHTFNAVEAGFLRASWLSRRRATLTTGVIVAAVMVALGALALVAWRSAQRAEREAIAARSALYENRFEQGRRALLRGDRAVAIAPLAAAYESGRQDTALRFMLARALEPLATQIAVWRGWAVAPRPGTNQVAIARGDEVEIWDLATRRRTGASGPLGEPVRRLRYDQRGQRLAALGAKRAAWLLDGASGARLGTFAAPPSGGLPNSGREMFFAEGDERLVLASWEGDPISSWTHVVVRCSDGTLADDGADNEGAEPEAVSSDGGTVLLSPFAFADRDLTLVDAVTLAPQGVLRRGKDGGVIHAAFSPDGSRIAVLDLEGVEIWARDAQQLLYRYPASEGRQIAFSPDGERFAIVEESTAELVDVASGSRSAALAGTPGPILAASFSPDGALFVTASQDGVVRTWDVWTGDLLASFDLHIAPVREITFHQGGAWMATVSDDETVRLWAMDRSTLPLTLRQHRQLDHRLASQTEWPARVAQIGFGPEPGTLAFEAALVPAPGWTSWEAWDLATGTFRGVRGSGGADGSGASDTPRDPLAQGGRDASTSCAGGSDPPVAVAMSADGELTALVAPNQERRIRVVETRTCATRWTLVGHLGAVHTLQFDPTDQLLLSASADRSWRIWDLGTGRQLLQHDSNVAVLGARFTPDGAQVVVEHSPRWARLWDTRTELRDADAITATRGCETLNGTLCWGADGEASAPGRGARSQLWTGIFLWRDGRVDEAGPLLASAEAELLARGDLEGATIAGLLLDPTRPLNGIALPDGAASLVRVADALYSEARALEPAARAYDAALALDPSSEAAWLGRAETRLVQGDLLTWDAPPSGAPQTRAPQEEAIVRWSVLSWIALRLSGTPAEDLHGFEIWEMLGGGMFEYREHLDFRGTRAFLGRLRLSARQDRILRSEIIPLLEALDDPQLPLNDIKQFLSVPAGADHVGP